ncbi:MAG TPA: phosphoribosyl-AMP cyclohydrolase [bacterium]|nr:phosphoribosyl-AMP cyclohydrolase [bacterium]HOL48235.1 phosphoribosyl-AMP cyclohydrolase [bacterium]HPQ18143.1 phosphoribosyl-AMP cyclohydrolase [bacterium]
MFLPNFKKLDGLIPVIVQDNKTNEIYMLAFMNEEAYKKTVETKKAHFYSRSRNKLWMKGEESGNIQIVKEILVDCDEDTIILKIEQVGGAACHTGHKTCFYRRVENNELVEYDKNLIFDPKQIYKK